MFLCIQILCLLRLADRLIGITLPSFCFCLYVYLCNKTPKDPTTLTGFILVAPSNHGLHQVEISTTALRLNNSISHNAKVISLNSIVISLKVLK